MIYCYYHANCRDGITAAAVVSQHYYYVPQESVKFIPVNYSDKFECPEDATEILIVDFSFRDELFLDISVPITIIDHHKSAKEYLERLSVKDNIDVIYDESKSGARLTYERIYGTENTIPDVVLYTEDRDLWRHELAFTKEINAYLQSLPLQLELWVRLLTERCDSWLSIGNHMLNYLKASAESHATQHIRQDVSDKDGKIYKACIFSYTSKNICSETCDILLKENPDVDLAIGYHSRLDKDTYAYSVRSRDSSAREFCESWGGGGHDQAAGLLTSIKFFKEYER